MNTFASNGGFPGAPVIREAPVYAVYTTHSLPRSRNRAIKRDNRRQ